MNFIKNNIKTFLFAGLLTTVFVLPSCNKYEDGPGVSLLTKKARVANTWEIEKALRNGEDVTDEYDNYTLTTTKNGDANLKATFEFGNVTYTYDTEGTWDFADSKETLVLDFENDDADNTYQILRLANDEMWIRETGGEDELQLKSK